MNLHLIPCPIRFSSILSLFHAATYSANSRSASTKFVSLSLMIVLGMPLRAVNLVIALGQLSVSNLKTISSCTALTFRQVNKTKNPPFVFVPLPGVCNQSAIVIHSNNCKKS